MSDQDSPEEQKPSEDEKPEKLQDKKTPYQRLVEQQDQTFSGPGKEKKA